VSEPVLNELHEIPRQLVVTDLRNAGPVHFRRRGEFCCAEIYHALKAAINYRAGNSLPTVRGSRAMLTKPAARVKQAPMIMPILGA